MDKFKCLFCGKTVPADVFDSFCQVCREPMVVSGDKRGRMFRPERESALEAFSDYLPLSRIDVSLGLGEGRTPLLRLDRLASTLNMPFLYAKNECLNPTSSFKDRGSAIVFQKAKALGIRAVGTVSTGNMASSTAAYGARAGLKTCIFLKEGTPSAKVMMTGFHGASLFLVKGDYGMIFRHSLELGRTLGVWFANSIDPYRMEGYKTLSFEIFLQMGRRIPRMIVVPVSSGGHLIGLMKGFLEMREDGLVGQIPVFAGVQAKGCSPMARAFDRGETAWKHFRKADTVAHAISNPSPPGGNAALKLIRENGGLLIDVSDVEILKAQRDLAEQEGLFCDPASAVTLAGLKKLKSRNMIRSRDSAVLIITGSGLKSMETLGRHSVPVIRTSLTRLEQSVRDHLK